MTSKDFLARFPHLQATEPLAQAAAINAKGGNDVSPNA